MFSGWSSLSKFDLKNFNTDNVINMGGIFTGCSALKKDNVISNNKKILKEIFKINN